MYPLSFEEFLNHKDKKLFELYSNDKKKKKSAPSSLSRPIIERINKHYDEFVTYGGYPRVVVSEDDEERIETLKNIYNTYFLKEIKEILQLTTDFKLSKLIKLLALQIGGIINYNELSSATEFNHSDLLSHLNILQKTFICIESRPFFTNKRKEIVKAPKIFFLDNGFRNIVIKNFQNPSERVDLGALNENFIASEIVKHMKDISSINYWRTKAKAEVDFVVKKTGRNIIPIEVKSNLRDPKLSRSFRNFLEEYRPKFGFILSKTCLKERRFKNTTVFFSPLFTIDKILRKF